MRIAARKEVVFRLSRYGPKYVSTRGGEGAGGGDVWAEAAEDRLVYVGR